MANHKPGSIWSLRGPGDTINAYVRTTAPTPTTPTEIAIVGPAGEHGVQYTEIILSRKDARLLAKRIQQCLEDTK